MTKQIPLTRGMVALVDDSDFDRLTQFGWYAWKPAAHNCWYAVRGIRLPSGKRSVSYMHRELLDARAGESVDHVDGDGLNNQRGNLRLCVQQENTFNQPHRAKSQSGFKGVSRYRSSSLWRARIVIDGKEQHLGCFIDPEEAARAYDAAARELFGEYARLNFPLPGERPARRQE